MHVEHAVLPVDQFLALAFTVLADVWPMATENGDRHHPMSHWRGRNFEFFELCEYPRSLMISNEFNPCNYKYKPVATITEKGGRRKCSSRSANSWQMKSTCTRQTFSYLKSTRNDTKIG